MMRGVIYAENISGGYIRRIMRRNIEGNIWKKIYGGEYIQGNDIESREYMGGNKWLVGSRIYLSDN
jgi:hypothetical protein